MKGISISENFHPSTLSGQKVRVAGLKKLECESFDRDGNRFESLLFDAIIKHSTPFNTQSKSKKENCTIELGNYVNSQFFVCAAHCTLCVRSP